uniref:Uncharacterized protein n=1 Tax=Candidatus Kentrum sp. DK TaxID=2126562 RepID=A0A450T5S6_9GAMM|nr:MAG: hypothetical protein BECKDK2373C_GA0170839_109314 [Candidatus Kentron sp. DK]
MVYRFSKLQDSMGMKILKVLLELIALAEEAMFAEKLQRLERLGAITSVGEWRMLRELRNQLSHEYEDAPVLKSAVLNRFLDVSEKQSFRNFAEVHSERPPLGAPLSRAAILPEGHHVHGVGEILAIWGTAVAYYERHSGERVDFQ